MNQLEIQFFWPLTEQISLELDYSNCEKPKLYTSTLLTGAINVGIWNSTYETQTQIIGNLSIDADKTIFKTSKKPNIIRRALFNVMGIKLEKK
jgi:hypothetical protein